MAVLDSAAKNPKEHAFGQSIAMPNRKPGNERNGEQHLPATGTENRLPHARELGEREFQTDGEEQQHHADLGQDLDLVSVRHEARTVGSDQRTSDQQPNDGRQVDLPQGVDHQPTHGEDDDQICKESELHGWEEP